MITRELVAILCCFAALLALSLRPDGIGLAVALGIITFAFWCRQRLPSCEPGPETDWTDRDW